MLPAGVVRSARAALMTLHLSGVVFRRKWEPPQLQPWEGPFSDPTQRLPQHPRVARERAEAKARYRLRRAMREREAAELPAERRYETDFPTSTRGDSELLCTPRQRSRPGDQLPSKTKFGP
jgi:hypothetical protein